MYQSCPNDWGIYKTGEGGCSDEYGKYQVSMEGEKQLEVYKNGNVRREITIKKNFVYGPMIIYNPKNGKLFAKFIFDKGKLYNAFFYDENGKEINNGGFKNGNGNLNFYRFSGSIAKVVEFKEGQANDTCSYYYSNGNVLATGTYKFGRPNGYWREYNQSGKEVQITKMAMGLVVTTESK